MSEDPDVAAVGDLLADPTARTILTETSQEPMSANALKEHCEASGPTIYRRLDRLRDLDLVVEQTDPDPEGGHHRIVYAPNFDRVTVDLADGGFEIDVRRREDMADRFTRLIEEM